MLRLSLWLAAMFAVSANGRSAPDVPVAVFTEVFNGYKRTRLADQSFKPETYVFGEGGVSTRDARDPSLEKMTFVRVASAVAAPLSRLNYLQAPKDAVPQLLILVFWGATQGSTGSDHSHATDRLASASAAVGPNTAATSSTSSATQPDSAGEANNRASSENAAAEAARDEALWLMSVENSERDRQDDRNARILGYDEALSRARFTQHMTMGQDVISEISNNRYFVVLQAYDFATAVKEKKLKPLWTARVSIDESGNEFAQSLDHMLAVSASFFGQDSGGLRRNVVKEGRVEVGAPKVIEDAPKK